MNDIEWLQNWYQSNCNDDWEHTYGVGLTTLDNPGWSLNIDLLETNLEGCQFDEVHSYRSDNDWLICKVKDNVFLADGDSFKLLTMFRIFREWVEANTPK